VRVEPDDVVDRAINHVLTRGRIFPSQLTLAPRGGSKFILYGCANFLRADYFLRKRSSRTTSAPSPGFASAS
jgi:hypothetical protein